MQIHECGKRGETICKYGEIGDRFFVVLKGFVGVKVPTDVVSNGLKNYLEVLKFVTKHY